MEIQPWHIGNVIACLQSGAGWIHDKDLEDLTLADLIVKMDRMGLDRSPKAWVNAADEVAEFFRRDAEELEAHARGFSCALEARWADDAADEQADREYGYN